MSDPRSAAYKAANDHLTAALEGVAAVHADDLELLGRTVTHLGAVLDLLDRQGVRPTWAQDAAILEGARDHLAAMTEQGSTTDDQDQGADDRPAGGPATG